MKTVSQRGGFVLGLVVGLLVGLAMALGVALYITKAPVPFVNKVPQRTAEQDSAEAEKNKNWDPNAPLAGKVPARPAPAASAAPASPNPMAAASGAAATRPVAEPGATPAAPARDPAAILSGGAPSTASAPAAFDYYVQVGAFSRPEDAEQQRAKLAIMGFIAKISEREQSGRPVYRVRLGPYATREEADGMQARLGESSIEARLVRAER